jgi:anion-transporting  ArsA/GET3 family ATPase
MDAFVQLQVPPAAETARLLTRHHRWGLYYRSLVGDTEGRLEFRQIDSAMLRADDVDPDDTDAVVDHIERRLYEAGYDTTRKASEDEPVAATWDIRPRSTP